jgi:hypothetical protein
MCSFASIVAASFSAFSASSRAAAGPRRAAGATTPLPSGAALVHALLVQQALVPPQQLRLLGQLVAPALQLHEHAGLGPQHLGHESA